VAKSSLKSGLFSLKEMKMSIELVLRWLMIMVIGLMPLLAPMWLGADYIFQPAPEDIKTAYGIVGTFLGVFVWLLAQYRKKEATIQKSDYYTPIIGFLIWCFITLFWIEDGYLAVLMLTQFVSYSLVFFLVVNTFKTVKNIELILKVLTIVLLIVSSIGLLQYYLIDNNFIQNLFLQAHSPGATFANKNMASHFVVMTIPLATLFLLRAQKYKEISAYSVITLTAFLFLMNTHARQGYLAIAIEIFAFILFVSVDYIKNRDRAFILNLNKGKEKLLAIVLIIFLLVMILNIENIDPNNQNKVVQNISEITIQGGSGRFPAWLNTIEMIGDYPIQGVGIGQWPESYPKYYDSVKKDVIFNEKLRLARLHNDYLEMLANVGLIGYLFLLWIAYLTIKKILYNLSRVSNNRDLILGTSLGLLGFIVVAMFSFPVRVYLPAFLAFLYLALISVISSNQVSNISIKKYSKKYLLYGVLIIGLVFMFVSKAAYSWLMGQHHYITALSYANNNHIESAKNEALMAIGYNPFAQDYYHLVAKILASTVNVESAIPYYKKVIDISPFNTIALLDLSLNYKLIGDTKMEKKVLNFILRFDPRNVRAGARLVVNLVNNKEQKNANIIYKNLKNNFEYFKNRPNFGPYHTEVAQTAMFVGDYKYVSYLYRDLTDRDPVSENYATLASIEYYYLNNKDIGIIFYKKALELDPNMPKNKNIRGMIERYESSSKP